MQKISLRLRDFYMNLPINFSSISGWRYPGIPRFTGNILLGQLTKFLNDDGIFNTLLTTGKMAADHPSGMCYFWIFNKMALLITKPEQVKEVLITQDKNISRRSATRFIESFWGPNIATDQREAWKKKRSVYLDHLAEQEALTAIEPQMHCVIAKYLAKMKNDLNKEINLRDFLSQYVLEVVLTLMTPQDPARDMQKFIDYTDFVGENVANIRNIFKWSLPSVLRKLIYRNELTDPSIVKAKMREDFNNILLCPYADYIKENHNFLRSLWQLKKDQPGQAELEKNSDVFGDGNALFFTAQDTVTSTLEFAIKLLAAHPTVTNKLQEELAIHLKDKSFTIENINSIAYLDFVIKETLRLYPASPMLPARAVDQPFKLDGLPLAKGDLLILSPYITQRLANVWSEPEKFDPMRFCDKSSQKISQHGYFPFGDGKHACVGWRFAYQQIKILLAAIYMNFRIEIENNDFSIKFFRTTIRPKNPSVARFVSL